MEVVELIATPLWSLGFLIFLWYLVTIVAAYMQEFKVGWERVQRKPRLAVFFVAMFGVATIHQFLALAHVLVFGKKATRGFAHYLMGSFYSWFGPFLWGPFVFEGAENLPKADEPCIYLANHQSSVDFCSIYTFPNKAHVVAIAKSSMKYLPGFGLMTGLAGGIYISRGKKGTMAMMLELGKERIADGLSIGIFPQGTRSVPAKGVPLKPFKKGGFILAVECQVPVVPFTLCYPDDFMSSSGPPPGVKIIVHPKVEPGDNVEALMEKVEKTVTAPLIKAKESLPDRRPDAKKQD